MFNLFSTTRSSTESANFMSHDESWPMIKVNTVHNHLENGIRPYIDLIDQLRSVGIQRDLALPTIVVIGDQSSGKSSVLEALSGVALPRGSGIVTRCPLELRLKKVTGGVCWKAVISYRGKRIEFLDSSLVEKHVETAQNELAGKGQGICDELITIEVMSSDVSDLTLIDLPGIARVPVEGQPHDIGTQIKNLITRFTAMQETINLVVVPCNTDVATTEALRLAQDVDPEGKRTIAVLTKPDLIDKGTEKNILDVVENKVIPLRKGYIMVKCRGQQQINEKISLEEAAQIEKEFFQNHNFFRRLLNEDKATTKSLSAKLTLHLVEHIKKSLPQLSEQIKKQLWEIRDNLKDCETGPPQDSKGARQFLIKILTKFNDQIKQLSSGELLQKDTQSLSRPKNVFVQLRKEFNTWNDHLNETKTTFKTSAQENIGDLQNFRGRELPGFINYKAFEVILQEQVTTLRIQATQLLDEIKGIILRETNEVVDQCFMNYPNLRSITKDKIDNIQSSQHAKAEQRISEQLEMEQMIYTQDAIFAKTLGTCLEEEIPLINKNSKYVDMLEAYYEIVVQRMADQLPMMIMFFMLKETAKLLTEDMLNLLEGVKVSELLFEDSDVSKRRKDLEARLDRLSIAEKTLNDFESAE